MTCNFPKEACSCPISKIVDASGENRLRIKFSCESKPPTSVHDITIRPGHWQPINKTVNEGDALYLDTTMPDPGKRLTWRMKDNTITVFYVDDKCMLPNACDCYQCIGIFPRPEIPHSVKHLPIESEIFTIIKLKAEKKCRDCGAINLYFRSTCWRCNDRLIKKPEEIAA